METNWCYAMCNSFVLPLVAMITFLWTLYQEYRHKKEKRITEKVIERLTGPE